LQDNRVQLQITLFFTEIRAIHWWKHQYSRDRFERSRVDEASVSAPSDIERRSSLGRTGGKRESDIARETKNVFSFFSRRILAGSTNQKPRAINPCDFILLPLFLLLWLSGQRSENSHLQCPVNVTATPV